MVETGAPSTAPEDVMAEATSPNDDGSDKKKGPGWAVPAQEKCDVCKNTVYAVERLEADKVVYHKV